MPKGASLDHPIHELISSRWCPYCFSARLVPREDLLSLFEAVRWAASSFNEQPWRRLHLRPVDRQAPVLRRLGLPKGRFMCAETLKCSPRVWHHCSIGVNRGAFCKSRGNLVIATSAAHMPPSALCAMVGISLFGRPRRRAARAHARSGGPDTGLRISVPDPSRGIGALGLVDVSSTSRTSRENRSNCLRKSMKNGSCPDGVTASSGAHNSEV